MAVVTRYFSTTAAGLGDGTSWANRAALFTAGNWSSIITGFDFTNDALDCRIEGGLTYTCSQSLASGLFTVVAPGVGNRLYLNGCNSSGGILVPPDPDWVSSQPVWNNSAFPVISSSSVRIVALANSALRFIRFESTVNSEVINANHIDWCIAVNNSNGSNSAAIASSVGGAVLRNSVGICNGTAFSAVINTSALDILNVRAQGNSLASSGTRGGISWWQTNGTIFGCTAINCPGVGLAHTTSSTARGSNWSRCLAYNCGTGLLLNTSAGQTALSDASGICAVNCSGYGVEGSLSNAMLSNCRLRNNTSGNVNGFANKLVDAIYDAAGIDADEFVDATNGDFRIKYGSAYWGFGIGPGDEPAPSGSGGLLLPRGMNGGFGD